MVIRGNSLRPSMRQRLTVGGFQHDGSAVFSECMDCVCMDCVSAPRSRPQVDPYYDPMDPYSDQRLRRQAFGAAMQEQQRHMSLAVGHALGSGRAI